MPSLKFAACVASTAAMSTMVAADHAGIAWWNGEYTEKSLDVAANDVLITDASTGNSKTMECSYSAIAPEGKTLVYYSRNGDNTKTYLHAAAATKVEITTDGVIGNFVGSKADDRVVFMSYKALGAGVKTTITRIKIDDGSLAVMSGSTGVADEVAADSKNIDSDAQAITANAAGTQVYFALGKRIRALTTKADLSNAETGTATKAVAGAEGEVSGSTDGIAAKARFSTTFKAMVVVSDYLVVAESSRIRHVPVDITKATTTVFDNTATAVTGYNDHGGQIGVPSEMAPAGNGRVYVLSTSGGKWAVSILETDLSSSTNKAHTTVITTALISTGSTVHMCGAGASGIVYGVENLKQYFNRKILVDADWFNIDKDAAEKMLGEKAYSTDEFGEVGACTYDRATSGKELIFFAKGAGADDKMMLHLPVGDAIETTANGGISNVWGGYAYAWYNKAVNRVKLVDGVAAAIVGSGSAQDGKGEKVDADAQAAALATSGAAVFFADSFRIRASTTSGTAADVDVTAVAGSKASETTAAVDADGTAARFGAITSMVYISGHLLVADMSNKVIRKAMVATPFAVTTVFSGGAPTDGVAASGYNGAAGKFGTPYYLSIAKDGGNARVYLAALSAATGGKWSLSVLEDKNVAFGAVTPYHIKVVNADTGVAGDKMMQLCGAHATKGLVYAADKQYMQLADEVTETTTIVNTTIAPITAVPSSAAPLAAAAAAIALMAL